MEKIFLKKLNDANICSLGEKINKIYFDDLKFVRTTVCENSYIEIITEKGYSIISDLKNDYNF